MPTPMEKLRQEVVDLSRRERLMLMRLLLDLDQPSKGAEFEKAWDQEFARASKLWMKAAFQAFPTSKSNRNRPPGSRKRILELDPRGREMLRIPRHHR